MKILENLLDRLPEEIFVGPGCAHIDCGGPGEHRRVLVNASTGERHEAALCEDHLDLVNEYDRRNRQARKIP